MIRTLVIPAVDSALEALEPFVESLNGQLESILRMQIVLALHELCLNIVEHGYAGNPGHIKIEGRHEGDELELKVTDQAPRSYSPPVSVTPPDPDTLPEGGWGISIMHSVMDVVQYERIEGLNCWLMRKHIWPGGE